MFLMLGGFSRLATLGEACSATGFTSTSMQSRKPLAFRIQILADFL